VIRGKVPGALLPATKAWVALLKEVVVLLWQAGSIAIVLIPTILVHLSAVVLAEIFGAQADR
jgi:hypothetical protein